MEHMLEQDFSEPVLTQKHPPTLQMFFFRRMGILTHTKHRNHPPPHCTGATCVDNNVNAFKKRIGKAGKGGGSWGCMLSAG